MSAWYDYPTERPKVAAIHPKPRGWSRKRINRANGAAPRQPARNEHIVFYKAQHPQASFSEIGRAVGCSRNTVAGVLDRARHGDRREPRSPEPRR